jgi:hypothetical protein
LRGERKYLEIDERGLFMKTPMVVQVITDVSEHGDLEVSLPSKKWLYVVHEIERRVNPRETKWKER